MPVREGAMQCTSCHNVHGSSNVRLLKAGTTIDESCQTCHADKRGPYLWEHAPVAESCVTCHDPHGSNNERMLVSKPPFLCQRCHVTSRHPPTVYEGYLLNNSSNGNKISGRSCVGLPPDDSRVQCPVGQDAAALGGMRCAPHSDADCGAPADSPQLALAQAPAPRQPRHAGTADSPYTGTVDVGGHVHRHGRRRSALRALPGPARRRVHEPQREPRRPTRSCSTPARGTSATGISGTTWRTSGRSSTSTSTSPASR